MDASEKPGRVGSSWALLLTLPVLLGALAVAVMLAWTHLELSHAPVGFESVCSGDGAMDCDQVLTSSWATLAGVPISIFGIPVYAILAWWAIVGMRDDGRGARARGGLILLSGACVGVSLALIGVMAFDLGAWCVLCLTLDALHVLVFVLALVPPGRRPAIPEGVDLIWALFMIVAVGGTSIKGVLIWADRLDRVAEASTQEADDAGVQETALVLEPREGELTRLPAQQPRVPVDRNDPKHGPGEPEVVVVTFGDFQSGASRRVSGTLRRLADRYDDRVRFVFKQFPEDPSCNTRVEKARHPLACAAATASICAHRQRAFRAYHFRLFEHPAHLERDDLVAHAGAVGLDTDAFERCLDDPTVQEEITEDLSHAAYLEVVEAPVTFVDRRRFDGAVDEPVLDAAIRAALGEAELVNGESVRTILRVPKPASLPEGPVDMVEVRAGEGSFAIDAVEGARDAEGRALSHAGADPAVLSWEEARDACAAAGKRLCSVEEWLTACQGVPPVDDDADGDFFDDYREGRRWPYGVSFLDGVCRVSQSRVRGGPRAAGVGGSCRTPEGVHDLAGNMAEWVGTDPESAALAGGAWYSGEQGGCRLLETSFGAGYRSPATGLRCCADAVVQAPEGAVPASSEVAWLGQGDAMPRISGQDAQGNDVDSARLEGRAGVVYFWASWCGTCRSQLPELIESFPTSTDASVGLMLVGVDRSSAQADAVLARLEDASAVVRDPSGSSLAGFGISSLPAAVVVDAEGRVDIVLQGAQDADTRSIERRVERLLAGD